MHYLRRLQCEAICRGWQYVFKDIENHKVSPFAFGYPFFTGIRCGSRGKRIYVQGFTTSGMHLCTASKPDEYPLLKILLGKGTLICKMEGTGPQKWKRINPHWEGRHPGGPIKASELQVMTKQATYPHVLG